MPGMKTTSASWLRAVKISILLLMPVATWWWSWRHYTDQRTAEANETTRRWLDEVQVLLEDSEKNVDEAARKFASTDVALKELKGSQSELERKRAFILHELETRKKTLEFGSAPPQRRTSWNGQTDPDSVWYGQRQRANQILMQNGLPALDGKGAFPDVAPLVRPFQRLNGQR